MKVTYKVCAALVVVAIVAVGASVSMSCNNDDNRTLSNDEVKQATAKNVKRIEDSSMPEATKKLMESHMGGAPAAAGTDPGADAAKAHGVNIPAGGRTH